MNKALTIISLCLAGLVTLLELSYYMAHQYRPGVSPHLIALGTAVILLAIVVLIKEK